jgi:hypothetical protein
LKDAHRILSGMERQWNALGHSSMASAIYAESLFATGYVYRGIDVAANVSGASWQKFSEYIERAHDVFDASADEGHECPLWSRGYFQISLSDGSSDQRRRERFEHALTFDPHDINIHFARAYQLTPRWGGSYDEIEVFAREAIGRTSDVLGCALYARIYWSLKDTYNLPETLADWGLLKAGFRDLLAAEDCQFAANVFASLAELYGDSLTVRQMLQENLREFHPSAWFGPDQALRALQLLAPR